ncbi:MAG TPA: hypothetical protein VIJ35_31905, partial [Bradyrhizobium sp.]
LQEAARSRFEALAILFDQFSPITIAFRPEPTKHHNASNRSDGSHPRCRAGAHPSSEANQTAPAKFRKAILAFCGFAAGPKRSTSHNLVTAQLPTAVFSASRGLPGEKGAKRNMT